MTMRKQYTALQSVSLPVSVCGAASLLTIFSRNLDSYRPERKYVIHRNTVFLLCPAKSEWAEPYVSAVVEEVSSEGVAKDPTFSVIVWKQLHLLPLLPVFAFDLNVYTQTHNKTVTSEACSIIGQ